MTLLSVSTQFKKVVLVTDQLDSMSQQQPQPQQQQTGTNSEQVVGSSNTDTTNKKPLLRATAVVPTVPTEQDPDDHPTTRDDEGGSWGREERFETEAPPHPITETLIQPTPITDTTTTATTTTTAMDKDSEEILSHHDENDNSDTTSTMNHNELETNKETTDVGTFDQSNNNEEHSSHTSSNWHVTIAHEPRFDLLGSFVLPTILLYGVAHYYNWTLQILPFAGSTQHAILTDLFAQKGNLSKDWGNGFQDANSRTDYNPMELNDKSYDTMGFFPEVINDLEIRQKYPWINRVQIPATAQQLNDACQEGYRINHVTNTDNECYILLSDHPGEINNYIYAHGGIDAFFTPEVCHDIRDQFLSKNRHRLLQYDMTSKTEAQPDATTTTTYFNVAVHIRRGDILDPSRWIQQQVFANVAKYICDTNTVTDPNIRTNIHVFSAGPNRDGNWSIMEGLATPTAGDDHQPPTSICANVYFHLDEVEFDSWTYFVAADALIISPSTFSYVPALIRHDNVYYPNNFWHPISSAFIIFDAHNGNILTQTNTVDDVVVAIVESNTTETNPSVDVIPTTDLVPTNTDHNANDQLVVTDMVEKVTDTPPIPMDTDPNIMMVETDPSNYTTSDPDLEHRTKWHVTMAHEPRYDLLGSFVLPTLLLYSVTEYQNWTLEIFPFAGSPQHKILMDLFAQKGNLHKDWGSGFQDASHRSDYNPMELNDQSYETMGFFPEVSKDLNLRSAHPWIRRDQIPLPGKELNDVCQAGNNSNTDNNDNMEKECYILLSDDTYKINDFINRNGGIDAFFTSTFSAHTRRQFLLNNHDRLQQYEITNQTSRMDTDQDAPYQYFNVAVHIRRGDILHPDRWIDQQVFANVARHICQTNTEKNESILTNIHVFSSGPNRDGNWSMMEGLADSTGDEIDSTEPVCANVYFHLDEVEFDSWTFMISADALVISTSTFSYVPGLIRRDNVYFPKNFWHPALSSFILFDHKDGSILTTT